MFIVISYRRGLDDEKNYSDPNINPEDLEMEYIVPIMAQSQ
jgi:hypothetical protein